MEFLKNVLGEELYNQVLSKINEHNGNEANKESKIKLANLESGDYVGKNKYSSLEQDLQSKIAELSESNKLIETLKKGTKGNEELQGKITTYESTIQNLQNELAKTKLDNAIKVKLLEAKATDLEYLTFKLGAQEMKLDEKGELVGWHDKLTELKTQFPNFFEGGTKKVYEDGKLPNNDDNGALSKESILKMSYADRLKMFNENPEAFKDATK